MNLLETRLEDQFHKASNQARLRELHAARDWNGLLEYALLLAEMESMGRTKVHWLAGEAMRQPTPVEDCHMQWARDAGGDGMSEKAAAVVTVHRIPEMTEKGRSEIVAWLHQMADWIQETPPEDFDTKLQCRYLYTESKQS